MVETRMRVAAGSGLSELELASGIVFGSSPRAASFPARTPPSVIAAIEQAILPALGTPPCLVSFSGGRDSSAVLAVAAALARREGLPAPIPATNVFPQAPASDEARWQEQVIRWLGLSDWLRIEHTDELDLIGPYAQDMLRRHGLLWPFNTHFHVPLLQASAGGSLLTGIGGDELFDGAERNRLAAVRARLVRPAPRDLARLGLVVAPHRVRRRALSLRDRIDFEWLRPRARRLATLAFADMAAREPVDVGERLRWLRGVRYLETSTAALALPAEDTGTLLVHPLLDLDVWNAVAQAAAPIGFAGRTDAMRRLLGGLLPDEMCARRSKATFEGAFWTERARAFARDWDGSGVPSNLVDADALANHWQSSAPAANAYPLLQAAWLSSARGVEQPIDGIADPLPATRTAQDEEGKRAELDQSRGVRRIELDSTVRAERAQPV
jgi:asparagine synthase (glutamine-hydrolysing)